MTEGIEDERLPKDFGKYRLTRRIATGGMAEIFLAHRHDAPLEPLVIKRILPNLTQTEGFVTMFLDEARIAASLDHPNVVRVEDIGQIDGHYFLAMEYIHGEDIRGIYNKAYRLQRSLPLSHSIQVIADAARGLAHAHRATDVAGRPLDLVHRDVSPQNILVTYDGSAKVVDFGIAKAAGKVAQTKAGVLKGKYSYMSPEQAMGEAIDHRTDLFALGIILFETTTGTRLFKRGSELATLQAIIKCEVTSPSSALPGYPAELERIVLRALARDPDARYQDGEVFAEDLERFLATSGLGGSRAAIAAFMGDLFADELAAAEASGEPVVAEPVRAKEEMLDPSARPAPKARVETELAPRRRRRDDEPMPGFADDAEDLDATRSERSGELPQVAHRAHTEVTAEPAADQLATVAAVAAYSAPPAPEPEPELELVRPAAEPTERIRMRPDPAAMPPPSMRPPVREASPWPLPAEPAELPPRPGRLVLMVGLVVALGAALGLAVVAIREVWANRDGDIVEVVPAREPMAVPSETAPPPPPPPAARVAHLGLVTEPGSDIYVDGDQVGTADSTGHAGPFELEPGPRLVRVVKPSVGFERQRSIELGAGQNKEAEIPARRGFLTLRILPWAEVEIDGKPMGVTPIPPIGLFEGVHDVKLVHPDSGATKTLKARVMAGEQQTLEVRLTP